MMLNFSTAKNVLLRLRGIYIPSATSFDYYNCLLRSVSVCCSENTLYRYSKDAKCLRLNECLTSLSSIYNNSYNSFDYYNCLLRFALVSCRENTVHRCGNDVKFFNCKECLASTPWHLYSLGNLIL